MTTLLPSANMGNTGLAGGFFSLPREIRDEIYRYLVKGFPFFDENTYEGYYITHDTGVRESAIFRVSKAVCSEATSVFYSESTFRYRFSESMPMKPIIQAAAFERMMNLQFYFIGVSNIHPSFDLLRDGGNIENNLIATLDQLTGLGRIRTSLLLKFRLNSSQLHGLLSVYMLRRLKALVGFRMIILDLGPMFSFSEEHDWDGYGRITQMIIDEMGPTMGPATVRQVVQITRLEFHPVELMRADLGGQAGRLQMEVDKQVEGGEGVEELE